MEAGAAAVVALPFPGSGAEPDGAEAGLPPNCETGAALGAGVDKLVAGAAVMDPEWPAGGRAPPGGGATVAGESPPDCVRAGTGCKSPGS